MALKTASVEVAGTVTSRDVVCVWFVFACLFLLLLVNEVMLAWVWVWVWVLEAVCAWLVLGGVDAFGMIEVRSMPSNHCRQQLPRAHVLSV